MVASQTRDARSRSQLQQDFDEFIYLKYIFFQLDGANDDVLFSPPDKHIQFETAKCKCNKNNILIGRVQQFYKNS